MSATIYDCPDCDWSDTADKSDCIDDVDERVMPGELMAAGQCPKCGALLGVDDRDVPDYVLTQVAAIMRDRGWTVPGEETPPKKVPADIMDATRRFLG